VWSACDNTGLCDFEFDLADMEKFAEVMAYYHITNVQKHIQNLGFTTLATAAIDVYVTADTVVGTEAGEFINTQSGSGQILFGLAYGLNVAADPKVIVHEYGHAIQTAAVGSVLDQGGEPSGLAEGFADYLALSNFAARESPSCQPCVAAFMNVGKCVRMIDNNIPQYDAVNRGNNKQEAHALGSIWTKVLWLTLTSIKNSGTSWDDARDIVDSGALLGNCYLGTRSLDNLDFPTAAKITMEAVRDDAVTTPYFKNFCDGFVDRKILVQDDCDTILKRPIHVH